MLKLSLYNQSKKQKMHEIQRFLNFDQILLNFGDSVQNTKMELFSHKGKVK
jgi:hypothetical protein